MKSRIVITLIRWTGRFFLGGAALVAALWAAGALAYDLPWPAARLPVALGFLLAVLWFVWRAAGLWSAILRATAGFAGVLAWWLTLQPSNERPWQPDVDRTAWGQVDGDSVTLHNVRCCDYRSETDFTARWETRVVRLSHLTGIDLAINYWGSPWMAHPIVSFQFADVPPLCFSIETRKELGEHYSAIGGIYRQFELIYVVAEESDVLGVRTRHRQGEDVYLYRTTTTPKAAQALLLEYLESINQLHREPRWYHALTTNCTTSIRTQRPPDKRTPWDWRLLVNGKGDELAYERGTLDRSLPFAELKRRSLINERARAAKPNADFSRAIRQPSFHEPIPFAPSNPSLGSALRPSPSTGCSSSHRTPRKATSSRTNRPPESAEPLGNRASQTQDRRPRRGAPAVWSATFLHRTA